ncbi:MAG: hypothetical protein ABSB87_13420 [Terriglobales bacterium]
MRKLTIVFHHAGGGHQSAAEALKATLARQQHPWDVTLLDIQELLDPLDLIRRATGLRIQDTYNVILRKGWTRFAPQLLVVLKATIHLYHAPIVKLLRAYWAEHPADLVLSVIPHFNREIAESLRPKNPAKAPSTPFVTLITDLADYPPHFWIERESEYIIAGTERARQQALTIGLPNDHIFLTSGMILKPRFYEEINVDRVAERKKLGLEPDSPTGIVLFGGHGSQVMLEHGLGRLFYWQARPRLDQRSPAIPLACDRRMQFQNVAARALQCRMGDGKRLRDRRADLQENCACRSTLARGRDFRRIPPQDRRVLQSSLA